MQGHGDGIDTMGNPFGTDHHGTKQPICLPVAHQMNPDGLSARMGMGPGPAFNGYRDRLETGFFASCSVRPLRATSRSNALNTVDYNLLNRFETRRRNHKIRYT
jgi:hypothetical protein